MHEIWKENLMWEATRNKCGRRGAQIYPEASCGSIKNVGSRVFLGNVTFSMSNCL
jgi:hypothetical protein